MSLDTAATSPIVRKTATGFVFYWNDGPSQDVAAEISRIKEDTRTGSINCEIQVAIDGLPYGTDHKVLLTNIRTNLLSVTARNTLISTLNQSAISEELNPYPWSNIVNKICSLAVNNIRQSNPSIILDGSYGRESPEYLLYPLFVKDTPTILYAERSSAKTLFANLICITLILPWHDNNIGFNIDSDDNHNVLILDWESNKKITDWQKECLVRGCNVGYCEFNYMRCERPLSNMIDDILHEVERVKADVTVIDSLGMAVGDDLNLTAPAFAFWSAARQIPGTQIILGHTSKDPNTKRKTVYGNAYYEAEARSVWELDKQQEINSNELDLTLFNRKSPPFASIHAPLAYHFTFEEDEIKVEQGIPSNDRRNSSGITEIELVESILAESDTPLMPSAIRDALEGAVTVGNIKVYLGRLLKAGKVTKVERGYTQR